ncbi:TIGR04255 family protein [Achromobacter xylosoxidans]|uniref:TIGR04255 family protein n=1 Tax=Alcaligenes xylosoxydans xylosoxydans TaxID=85698 RepID=UPI0009B6BADB|nr:TIGR04255 family protein [Achromobacter xylosoxidans]
MSARPVPTNLSKVPLVDALFEMRVDAPVSLAVVLPGVLLSGTVPGEVAVERLPIADIPEPVRQATPELRYQPTMRIRLKDASVALGDRVVVIGARGAYPGWTAFQRQISILLDRIQATSYVKAVERYSLKYVDLIEEISGQNYDDRVKLSILIGGERKVNGAYQLRGEIKEAPATHVLTVAAPATVQNPEIGFDKTGMVIDVDSIVTCDPPIQMVEFRENLSEWLTSLHDGNKRLFFSMLTDLAIDSMGPSYE